MPARILTDGGHSGRALPGITEFPAARSRFRKGKAPVNTNSESVRCNLCGSDDSQMLHEIPDYLLGRTAVRARFVRCRRCGLIYQSPRPPIDLMDAHYPPAYGAHAFDGTEERTSWLFRTSARYGLVKRARVVTRYRSGGRLLDVGCGTGEFLDWMQRQPNWRVEGVETSTRIAGVARDRYGLSVFTGQLEQAAFPEKTFDTITMWDVLEHLHDPSASLKEVHRVLNDSGTLILRVPNADSLERKVFDRYWSGLDAPRHLYVFSPHTLRDLLERAHFKILEISSGAEGYSSFILSLRFWLNKGHKGAERGGFLDHPMTRLFFGPLFYLLGLTALRSRMTVVASKRDLEDAP